MPQSTVHTKNNSKYVVRIFSGLLFLALMLFGLAYYVAFTEQHRVPEIVTRLAREKLNVELGFSGYEFSCTTGFPYISLKLKDVFIKGVHDEKYERELIRIKSLSFKFQPIKFIRKIYMAHEVELDSVSVNIYKDSLGVSNLDFLKLLKSNKDSIAIAEVGRERKKEQAVIDLDIVRFHDLQFNYVDDFYHKSYQVDMPIAIANLGQVSTFHDISFDAECYFHQLLFKKGNGPFLRNKNGKIRLDIRLDDAYHQMKLLPSTLKIDDHVFHLSGGLTNSDTDYLELKIVNDGILIKEALPLLSDKIRQNLSEINVDKPIAAEVNIAGDLIPGFPPSISVDFNTAQAGLTYGEIYIEQACLTGRFMNDCLAEDKIGPHTGCLEIDSLVGRLMGNIPLELTGNLQDLKNFKKLETDFYLNIPLVELNEYIPTEQDVTIFGGGAILKGKFNGSPKVLASKIVHNNFQDLVGEVTLSNGILDYGPGNIKFKNVSGGVHFDKNALILNDLSFTAPGVVGRVNGNIANYLSVALGQNERLNSDIQLSLNKINADQFIQSIKRLPGNKKEVIPIEKKIAGVIKSIHEKSALRINISANKFQYNRWDASAIALDLHISENSAKDSMENSEPSLHVDQFRALLFNEIAINNSFSIVNIADPEIALTLKAELPASAINRWLPKDTFEIEDGAASLIINLAIPVKHFHHTDSLINNLRVDGEAQLAEVHANYFLNDIAFQIANGNIRFGQNKLMIDNMHLGCEDIFLNISGTLDNYLPMALGKKEPLITDLSVNIPALDGAEWPFLKKPTNTVGHPFSPKKMTGYLSESLNYTSGELEVVIGEFYSDQYPMKNVSFSASLMGDCGNNSTGNCLVVSGFNAGLWGTTPIGFNLELSNFEDPFLNLNLDAQIPFRELGRFAPEELFGFYEGTADMKLNYAGKLHEQINAENYILKSDLKGTVNIKDGEFDYKGRGLEFRKIKGEIHFDENNLSFHDLVLSLNKNRIEALGLCPSFMPYFFTDSQHFHIDFDLYSPRINFDHFSTPEELGIAARLQEEKEEKHLIEEILETGTIEMALKVDQAYISHFDPEFIDGRVKVSAEEIELKELKMKVADGGFYIHGHINDIEKHNPKAEVVAKFTNNNIREVFKSFENFGQTDMTHENINGTFYSDISLNAAMDANYEIVPSSLSGKMQVRVDNGELINLEALKNLTGFIFKKRKLDNIAFDTLTTSATLHGYDLKVNQFFVHSTSFDFGVDGVYHLGPHDKTSLLFEIPLGNIFKRHIDKEILMQHDTKRKGPPIMVSATEKNNRLHFKLHLLKGRSKLKK